MSSFSASNYRSCNEAYGRRAMNGRSQGDPSAARAGGSSCTNGTCVFHPSSGMTQSSSSSSNGAAFSTEVQRRTVIPQVVQDFEEWDEYLKHTPLTMVYVWKSDCYPCEFASEQFDKLAEIFSPRGVKFWKDCIDSISSETPLVNGYKTPSMLHWNMAEVVPFFVIYFYNSVHAQISGFEERDILQAIEKALEGIPQVYSTQASSVVQRQPPPTQSKTAS